ncbi:MAG: STAS domain-containing protein [Flavobacteriia bacterium]|nr:STAS domain-containing protein [Flavobacteriia bacterium]OJX39246.1 MAG: hypothetical protein BGO87_04475 [Flavobacteriia bacterium 40-80]
MKFEIIEKPSYDLLVSKVEKIDASNATELRGLFTELQNKSRNKVVVDLSDTKYCDSSGLSALLLGHRNCRDTNGKFVVCGIQPMVDKLIKIAQLDKVLQIAGSREKAEQEIG